MSLFSKKGGSGKFVSPTFDPYNQWKGNNTGFLGIKKDKHVILPGVTSNEEFRLSKIRKYVAEKTEEDCTLPQHMINDVYSMYVNEDIKRKAVDKTNVVKQKVIDKVYNSLTKVVTQNSPLFTQVLTRELALYMQKIEKQIKEEEEKNGGKSSGSPFDGPEGDEDGQGKGQGQGDGDGEEKDGDSEGKGKAPTKDSKSGEHGDLEKKMDDLLNKKSNEQELEKAMKNAEETMKDLEDKLGKEALADLAENDADFLDNINNIKGALKNVSINKESIKQVLVKILNKSQNYFSQNFHTVEEGLFEAEDFDDLFGLEFLHPIFRASELDSAGNATRIYTGKIDLYLDCSGSMGSYENFGGTNIRMIDLVKGIAMVLFRMGMIDKLYFFDGSIYEIETINEFTILGFNKSGGTNFDNVITQCQKNGRNSVIITDGEDSCSKYTKNAFFVGVGGTKFGGYRGEGSFKDFKKARQCVTYDSDKNKFDYVKQ